MDIKAYKMDGLGNDFVIIDQRIENIQNCTTISISQRATQKQI